MGKRDKETKREKRKIVYRTKEERKNEVCEILNQLTKFELTPRYEPVKKLYEKFVKIISKITRSRLRWPWTSTRRASPSRPAPRTTLSARSTDGIFKSKIHTQISQGSLGNHENP